MIRRAFAIRFNSEAETGRTKPLRVTIETDDGVEHDVFLKVTSGIQIGIEGLVNEMLGSLLAADLGLPVNEPFFVELDPEFVAAMNPLALKQRLASSCPLAFASKDAGRQWRRWLRTDRVAPSQVGLALAIVAFDAFIANHDRRPDNPNLLVKDQAWLMIDHEAAFSFGMKWFPKCEPWKTGNLAGIFDISQAGGHVFGKDLTKRNDLSFDEVEAAWTGLSDGRLAQYEASLPEEWASARPSLLAATEHIRRVRDTIGLCLAELRRVLS